MLQLLLQYILKKLARQVTRKYNPKIIGITGSVGKTTTKEAIILVLSQKYQVRGNIKNYNNEIGLPLTILGLKSPGRSLLGWFKVFCSAIGLLILTDKNYPEFLILEMGVDHPGDMDYLLSFIHPVIGVMTVIGQAHLEFFGSQDNIAKEKGKLIEYLPEQGVGVLNIDDQRVAKMVTKSKAKIITYGFGQLAEVRATDLVFNYQTAVKLEANELSGLSFKINYHNAIALVSMPLAISEASVYSALAAAAVGISQGVELLSLAEALVKFQPPRGRLNILSGQYNNVLLDDSYNASPTSVMAALDILNKLPVADAGHRVAVLGDMLELGVNGPAEHRRLGQIIAKLAIGRLILIGPLAAMIGQEAEQQGWVGKINYFAESAAAAAIIDKLIPEKSAVLLKGSQGSRIERITKQLLSDSNKPVDCLVRQEDQWLNS